LQKDKSSIVEECVGLFRAGNGDGQWEPRFNEVNQGTAEDEERECPDAEGGAEAVVIEEGGEEEGEDEP